MILKGNQRGGAKNLAVHLMKDENDRVPGSGVRARSVLRFPAG